MAVLLDLPIKVPQAVRQSKVATKNPVRITVLTLIPLLSFDMDWRLAAQHFRCVKLCRPPTHGYCARSGYPLFHALREPRQGAQRVPGRAGSAAKTECAQA